MSQSQEAERIQQIRKNLEIYDTQFLANVWKTNDRRKWTPEAFDAIHEILLTRLGSVPAQKTRNPRESIQPRERKQRFFLTRFEGEIEFDCLSVEDAHRILGRLRAALSVQGAKNLHLSGNKVTFQVSIFRFVSNWNVLVPVDRGEISAYPGASGAVKYSFSFIRMFLIATFVSALFFLTLVSSLGSDTLAIIVIPVIAWLFMFGLNFIIAVIRLQDFVWQAISH